MEANLIAPKPGVSDEGSEPGYPEPRHKPSSGNQHPIFRPTHVKGDTGCTNRLWSTPSDQPHLGPSSGLPGGHSSSTPGSPLSAQQVRGPLNPPSLKRGAGTGTWEEKMSRWGGAFLVLGIDWYPGMNTWHRIHAPMCLLERRPQWEASQTELGDNGQYLTSLTLSLFFCKMNIMIVSLV